MIQSCLTSLPIWNLISQYILIETYGRDGGPDKPRHRIEFKPMPEDVARQALDFRGACIKCGRSINPIRRRKKWGTLYYAPSCPLNVNVACSRGPQAAVEYAAVVAELL